MKSVHAKKAYLPTGWADDVRLSIADGAIAALDVAVVAEPADSCIDYVIPGLCNAHSHAFQRALAGHTEQRSPQGRDNFWSWRERMYSLAGRVDAASLTAIAAEAYAEMLASGFTSVVEFHYLHRDPTAPQAAGAMFDALVEAVALTGIRMTYVPVHYERAGFSAAQPTAAQQHFCLPIEEFLQHVSDTQTSEVAKRHGIKVGIGAHSLRAVAADSLAAIADRAADQNMPMHIHVAEQTREIDDCMSHYGRRPVRWLLENFPVDAGWSLVHATHMDKEEVAALAESNAIAVLCPSTEANLGDGLFPLQPFLADGGRIAIGSDSHISINPFEELRWLEYGQRLVARMRNVVSLRGSHVGSELFVRALQGGGISSGQGSGELRVGGRADFIVLNAEDPMLLGHDDESRLDALVFSGYPLPVERAMVNGVWQLRDAEHRNREEIVSRFGATMQQLRAAL